MSKIENQGEIEVGKKVYKPLLTVKEVSSLIGESVHVIRNWLKDLKDYIPIDKSEAGYNLFGEEATEKLRTVQRLHRDNGYSMKQIEYYFATGGKDFIPVPSAPEAEEILAKELQSMKEDIKMMREQLRKQEEFNMALIRKLEEQQKTIQSKDELLLQSMSEIKKYNMNLQLMAAKGEEQVKPRDPVEERQDRITEAITMNRIKSRLREEAIDLWAKRPEEVRMKKVGWFRKEEDHAARDLFVRAYTDDHLPERLAQEYGIDKV
jgi:DNA-binding transcriptional MerR regulator